MRLFFGVFPPRQVQETLAESQSRLRGNWKPVRAEQMHVTLGFLGEVPRDRLEEIIAAGESTAATVAPFAARIRGTGFFPNEGRPRVWFARAEGDGFGPLALGLREELPDLLAGEQAFKAHITLARRKGPAPRVGPVIFELEFPVKGFVLVESTLTPRGPVYKPIKEFSLKGA